MEFNTQELRWIKELIEEKLSEHEYKEYLGSYDIEIFNSILSKIDKIKPCE